MAKFLITYSGGDQPGDMTEEQRAAVMQAWEDWYAGLGDAVIDHGDPTGAAKTVSAGGAVRDGGGGVTGYSLIDAASLEAAAEACRRHPHLDASGEITVYETWDMG